MDRQSRVQILLDQFNSSLGLPFQKLLPASTIEETLFEEGIKYRNRLFSPMVTLWAFLSQVIDADQTCHNTVSRVIAWLAGKGEEIPSEDPSAYCQARTRLPENFLKKLFGKVGLQLEEKVQREQLWFCIPGWRTKQVTLITTLLDAQAYPIREIAELYNLRWEVELDLRHIKTTLGMDVLRSKTPEMVRKEISVHLLAYNLLRTVMWEAGTPTKVNPLRLSLQEARHHLDNFVAEMKNCGVRKRKKLYQTMLEVIAHKPLKKRVGRFEPRVRKRRPKAYPLMTEPRSILRQKVA